MQNFQQILTSLIPYILPAIGITLILYSTFKKSTEEKLEGKGVYTDGIVFNQGYSTYDDNSSNAPDKITVRFVTKTNEWITVVAKNDFGTYYSNQYKDGENVKILYNPEDPFECIILSKQSEKTVRIILIFVGFALCIIGLIQLFK